MPTAPNGTFELPDTTASLPRRPFEFSPTAADQAAAIVALPPEAMFRHLLREQESEATLLAARRIIHAFLRQAAPPASVAGAGPVAGLAGVRERLAATVDALARLDPDVRHAVLRQRAPLALVGGCWLDTVSQPATQPSVVVNRLFAQHHALKGEAGPRRGSAHLRRRALERAGVDLPPVAAADFLHRAQARPLTCLHASFYLALSRLPANFLPEVVGVHCAYYALGVDDLLLGTAPPLSDDHLRAVSDEFLALAGPAERARMLAAVGLVLTLEQEQVGVLAELADWLAGLSLESKVAEIVRRHAPYAGSQHGGVRLGDRLLADVLADPALDLAAFIREFRASRYVRPTRGGDPPFVRATKFGGPMFGIFDEREAATFKAWAAAVQAGDLPEVELSTNTVGDERAAAWTALITGDPPADVVLAHAHPRDDRELFHRLVNIENFANTLPLAAERAERLLAEAEILFVHGGRGRYTDASYFDYTPDALYERGERVYWDKLVNPYRPLTDIPARDEVIFAQTTYALGSLIDGAWIHRTGNLGHDERPSDAMLFSIYADEMGHGDLRKNHLTLIHRALRSMGIALPHIRDAAFMDQAELPDDLYGFSLHQLCMAMFPDRFYNEILGYNFAIEMFGLGEFRLHEIQKLRHHGFDDCYEQAHLTIDNYSAGHTKQAADIIVSYLDGVRRAVGDDVVQQEWRRIWRGYASFAYFVEHALLKEVASAAAAPADLVL